ncbi:OTU protein [Coemansia sp. RSA 1646]|nr:OTU protein [Coemansia sp. RSA 1646]
MSEINETPDDLAARHRKEKKELITNITTLKKLVPKGDKRRKKEAAAEIEAMEKQLKERHAAELRTMDAAINAAHPEAPAHGHEASSAEQNSQLNAAEGVDQDRPGATRLPGGKKNKAKMRLQRRAEEMKRMQEEAEQEAEGMVDMTAAETEAMNSLAASAGLSIKEIRPDGHCLYSAFADQMTTYHNQPSATHLDIRSRAAEYMRANRDDFLPFMTHDSGDMFSEADFADHCDRVENTADWGGQHEITALSHALQLPVHIYQTGAPLLRIGEEAYGTKEPIRLSYHRHAYGLGEHYNSLHKAA